MKRLKALHQFEIDVESEALVLPWKLRERPVAREVLLFAIWIVEVPHDADSDGGLGVDASRRTLSALGSTRCTRSMIRSSGVSKSPASSCHMLDLGTRGVDDRLPLSLVVLG